MKTWSMLWLAILLGFLSPCEAQHHASALSGTAVAQLIEKDDETGLAKLLHLGLDPDSLTPCFNGASQMTLLEYACTLGSGKVLQVLVSSGANKGLKSGSLLPIEMLLHTKHESLAPLLKIEPPKLSREETWEMLAARLLEPTPDDAAPQRMSKPAYITINHETISESLRALLESRGMKIARPGSAEAKADAVEDLSFSFDSPDPFNDHCINVRMDSGKALSGGGLTGTFVQRYGYWLLENVKPFDK